MDKRTKTWLSIIGAVLAIVMILGAVAVGGTAYWVFRHVHTETVAQETASDTFARARQRFAGARPMLEIRGRDDVVVHRSDKPPAAGAVARLQTLHALVYDPDRERLVDVNVPFWLLRLAPGGGRFSFLSDNGIDLDSDRIHVTIADLEREGPGLVVDHRDGRGSLVLVWTE